MPEDRLKLGPVLMKSLKRKLLSLLKAQDMPGYRFLLNHETFVFRGLDCNLFEPVPAFEQEHLDMDFSPLVTPSLCGRERRPISGSRLACASGKSKPGHQENPPSSWI